jgi:hypothetical protein
MVDQVTFDIGGGVSAAASVLQFVQGMLTGARSVTVEVDNNTDLTLVLGGQHHDHGGFAKIPLDKIGPYAPDGKGCVDVFGSQNRGGSFATGTEGWVGYRGHVTTRSGLGPKIFWFAVTWNNPYVGPNKASVRLDIVDKSKHSYKVRYVVGAGNTLAPFRFQLYPADKISGPIIQDITEWV